MKEKAKIIRNAGTVGMVTLISRVFGYFRDAAMAIVLGAGFSMDAFTVAYRLANLFRRFFAEGTMTAAFVPVFAEWRTKESRGEMWDFARRFFYSLGAILAGIVILEIIFSPLIVTLMAPGFADQPEKFQLTVLLNQWMAPYLLTIGLAAVLMAVLNSEDSFLIPASTPIFFNIAIIISAFTLAKSFSNPAFGIAVGVLAGGLLQLAIQVPFAMKKGMKFKIGFSLNHPAIRRVSILMGSGIFAVGIVQINLLVDSVMASFLPEGSVSSLYYANRITELTLGTFITSLATVILPSMSDDAAKDNKSEMTSTLAFSMRMTSMIAIPASIGLLVLAKPIIQFLFEHGRFTAADTERTVPALAFYAVGLFFVAGARIVVPSFYAVKDPKTPVRCAVVSLVVNIAGNLILMHPLKQGGIALATSIAAAVNFFQLLWCYEKQISRIDWNPLLVNFRKVTIASIVLGVTAALCMQWFGFSSSTSIALQALSLFGTIIASCAAYAAALLVLQTDEAHKLWQRLNRKKA